jgi:ribosomal protein L7/L12
MAIVEINGWLPGFKKVSCTKALQSAASIGLAEAKNITDAVLDGKQQTVRLRTSSEAEQLADTLQQIGALVKVIPSD